MKIVLINPDFGEYSNLFDLIQPLAMYQLASTVAKDHDVVILDPILYKTKYKIKLRDSLLKETADAGLVAFSANSFNYASVLPLLPDIKNYNQNIKIAVGGVHATHCSNYILESNPYVDYALIAEGEESFPALISFLEGKINVTEVPNLVYRTENENINHTKVNPLIELTTENIPMPMYDRIPEDAYDGLTFEASRGCYGRCKFCSTVYHKCWRRYELGELEQRLASFQTFIETKSRKKKFVFADDCFITDRRWSKEVMKKMLDMGYNKYETVVESRARNLYDAELLEYIARFNGKMHLQIGIESGYQSGLDRIEKQIKEKDIYILAHLLKEFALNKSTFFSFIVGFPWENVDMCMKTVEVAAKVKYVYGVDVNIAWWLPTPSELFKGQSKLNNNFDFSLFDNEYWFDENELFAKTHPNITYDIYSRIKSYMNLFKAINCSVQIGKF